MGEENNKGFDIKKMLLFGGPIGCASAFFIFFPLFVVILFVLGLFEGGEGSGGSVCINVKSVDEVCKTITSADFGTVSVDEYVAMVISQEVGGMTDETFETYKAFAVAARTYALYNSLHNSKGASRDSNGNCSVPKGQSFQDYNLNPDQNVIDAVEATSGMVLVKDNNLIESEYDAMAWYKEENGYFYLYQGGKEEENQKIPSSWVRKKRSESYIEWARTNQHGRGMSQNGAWYLAEEKKYSFTEILDFYYGDEGIELASTSGGSTNCVSSNNGNFSGLQEYNFNHNGLKKLNKSLTDSQIEKLESYIESEVKKAGYGTGAAVAAAGQSLAYGLEQYGYYLGYYWGGDRSTLGVSKEWGTNKGIAYTSGQNPTGPEWGMDCSGFVSWAIRNACKSDFGSVTADKFMSYSSKSSISLSDAKPGDVAANSGHVILIVKNNGDGSVITVESSYGGGGVVFRNPTSLSDYKIVDMSSWYSENCK